MRKKSKTKIIQKSSKLLVESGIRGISTVKRKIFSTRMRSDNAITLPIDGPTFGEYVSFIRSPWKAFWYSFLRGTGFGLGTLIGAALVVGFLSYLVKELGWVPVIGEWLSKFAQVAKLPS